VKVLVVDDYPGAADIVCVLLRLLGHDAQAATTGTGALELASTFAPDVIVLDLGLPDVSGLEVARALRSREGKRPFIAAMTGHAQPEDRVHSLAAGIDLHVLKPATEEKLTRILDAAQRRLSAAAVADRA